MYACINVAILLNELDGSSVLAACDGSKRLLLSVTNTMSCIGVIV